MNFELTWPEHTITELNDKPATDSELYDALKMVQDGLDQFNPAKGQPVINITLREQVIEKLERELLDAPGDVFTEIITYPNDEGYDEDTNCILTSLIIARNEHTLKQGIEVMQQNKKGAITL